MHHSGNQKESLFGAIDHTKTVAGGRLLRSNILRPSTGNNITIIFVDTLPVISKLYDFIYLI